MHHFLRLLPGQGRHQCSHGLLNLQVRSHQLEVAAQNGKIGADCKTKPTKHTLNYIKSCDGFVLLNPGSRIQQYNVWIVEVVVSRKDNRCCYELPFVVGAKDAKKSIAFASFSSKISIDIFCSITNDLQDSNTPEFRPKSHSKLIPVWKQIDTCNIFDPSKNKSGPVLRWLIQAWKIWRMSLSGISRVEKQTRQCSTFGGQYAEKRTYRMNLIELQCL